MSGLSRICNGASGVKLLIPEHKFSGQLEEEGVVARRGIIMKALMQPVKTATQSSGRFDNLKRSPATLPS